MYAKYLFIGVVLFIRQQLCRIPQPKNIATTTTTTHYVSRQCLIGSIKLQLRILIPGERLSNRGENE